MNQPIRIYSLLLTIGLLAAGCQAGSREAAVATTGVATPEEEEQVVPTATPNPATPTPEPETMSEPGTADADVLFVRAVAGGDSQWTFHVTVAHPDTGWEDYADGWDVVLPDGTVLKPQPDDPFTRLLLHPHETEQPFTRSQSGLLIPAGVTKVRVRAHDLVDGFGGQEVMVDLTAASGPNFEVKR